MFQLLLNPEMVKACPTLIPYVYDFLENKAYSKGKGEFARKVSKTFVYFPLELHHVARKTNSRYSSSTPADRHFCKSSQKLHEEHVQRSEGPAGQSG